MHPIRQRLRRLTRFQRFFAVGIVMMVIVAAFWHSGRRPEPVSGGRTASEWLRIYSDSEASELQMGDRYEAVLAFRAMGKEGVHWLVQNALPPKSPGWLAKVCNSFPVSVREFMGLDLADPRSAMGQSASVLLSLKLRPAAANLLPYSSLLRSSDIGERQAAAYWFGGVRKEDAATVVPLLVIAAQDTNAFVSMAGFQGLDELGAFIPNDTSVERVLWLTNAIKLNKHGAWRLLIKSGDAVHKSGPLIESMLQSSSDFDRLNATATLLRWNPERTELLGVLTNALVSTDNSIHTSALHIFRFADTRAFGAVPFLKELAFSPDFGTEEQVIIESLARISQRDAIEVLAQRIRLRIDQQKFTELPRYAGMLMRLAPPASPERLLAAQVLEKVFDAVVAKTVTANSIVFWEPTLIVTDLEPESFQEPPPSELFTFLQRIADQHPDAKARHAAAQALKYFHLRWPK